MVCTVTCMSTRWVWHLCNLLCVYALFRLISIARYAFKSPRICFWGTKYEIYHEHVAYLHSILWCRARLWLELLASTVGRSLSRIWYLFSNDFLRRCHSFTLRKLYVCLETLLCFLQLSDRACFSCSVYRFIPPLVVLAPHDSNVAVYVQVLLTVLRVLHAIVRLSSRKTMVSILHVDLISCRYFLNTLYVVSC